MVSINTKHLSKKTIVFSYAIFLLGWTLRVVFLDLSGLNEYLAWTIGFLTHVIWWPLFALYLIKKYSSDLNISFKEMVQTKPDLKILFSLMLLAVAYNLIAFFIGMSGFGTDMKLYDLIITVATVGIFEESVFRGWFLNSISTFLSNVKQI